MWKHPNLRIAYVAQHAFHHVEQACTRTCPLLFHSAAMAASVTPYEAGAACMHALLKLWATLSHAQLRFAGACPTPACAWRRWYAAGMLSSHCMLVARD